MNCLTCPIKIELDRLADQIVRDADLIEKVTAELVRMAEMVAHGKPADAVS